MTNNKTKKGFPVDRRAFTLGLASTIVMSRAAMADLAREDVTSLATPEGTWQEPYDPQLGNKLFGTPAIDYSTLASTTLQSTEAAIAKYSRIAASGGWPIVPEDRELKLNERHPNVEKLRARLLMTGDLEKSESRPAEFDEAVEMAVRHFQYRHGLYPDGIVRGETLQALNVSAADRLQQLRINIVRLRSMAESLPPQYVLVNVPAQEVEAVDNEVAYSRHVAIVGRPERQTPIINSKIHELNFSPYWHVPRSIIEKDLIPQVQKDPEYLAKYQIRIYDNQLNEVAPEAIDWYSEEPLEYSYRQDPGEDLNAMGAVKINFHNQHAVFLHDTPDRDLFEENYRAFSSGCIRVQNVGQLITWVLKNQTQEEWSRAKVDAVINSGERIDVPLDTRVPIFLSYITAWGQPDGPVQFRRDLYDKDGIAMAAAIISQ